MAQSVPSRVAAASVMLALIVLSGCASEGGLPFLSSPMPASGSTQPDYPPLVPPSDAAARRPPVLSEEEQKVLEEQLQKLGAGRERTVRRRIERSQ
jgi:hypothetical protein